MTKDLKQIHVIDLFVLILTGDRLANQALMENMKLLELLCGGRAVWSNIILVLTKQDYNPMLYENKEEYMEHLTKLENEARIIVKEAFD